MDPGMRKRKYTGIKEQICVTCMSNNKDASLDRTESEQLEGSIFH